jgi:hypothetical protein
MMQGNAGFFSGKGGRTLCGTSQKVTPGRDQRTPSIRPIMHAIRLERALRIEALSSGWRSSFERYCRAKRLPRGVVTPGSRQQQAPIGTGFLSPVESAFNAIK